MHRPDVGVGIHDKYIYSLVWFKDILVPRRMLSFACEMLVNGKGKVVEVMIEMTVDVVRGTVCYRMLYHANMYFL